MCDQINVTLEELFPKKNGVTVISEPGRFFVEGALTIGSCIIGKSITEDKSSLFGENYMLAHKLT